MSPVWTTFLTSMISSIALPYLERKYGASLPKLDATEQTALTAGVVGSLTGSAHWLHTKMFPHRKHR